MIQEQACRFVMPIGKYKGTTLERIATTDSDGPRYLDWMNGNKDLGEDLKEALEVFLAIPWVSELVSQAVEARASRPGSTEPVENKKKPKHWWE